MAPRIVLLGATGYTGARTAEALTARGARPVLAGRDPDRLSALAGRLGGLETARAAVADPPAAGPRAARLDVGYALDGTSGQAFSRGTLVSLLGVLTERSFAFRQGKLRTEASGARTWRFTAAGRRRIGLSVGGSEHLTLPELAPQLDEVGVYLAWFGPMTTAASVVAPLVGFAGSVPGAQRGVQRLADAVG